MIQSHVKMGRGLNDDNTEFAEITLREMGLCRGKWLRTQHCYLKGVSRQRAASWPLSEGEQGRLQSRCGLLGAGVTHTCASNFLKIVTVKISEKYEESIHLRQMRKSF